MTEVSCQLIRFLKTKSFLGNSKNGERNHVNEQRTHKYRERGENLLVNVQMSMYLLRFTLYFKSIYNAF